MTLHVTVPFAVAAGDRLLLHIRDVKNPPSGTRFATIGAATTTDYLAAHPTAGQFS